MTGLSIIYRYLLNFLLDSTLGIFIIYFLFKIIKFAVNYWDYTPLKTGEYGIMQSTLNIYLLLIRYTLSLQVLVSTVWGSFNGDASHEACHWTSGHIPFLDKGISLSLSSIVILSYL